MKWAQMCGGFMREIPLRSESRPGDILSKEEKMRPIVQKCIRGMSRNWRILPRISPQPPLGPAPYDNTLPPLSPVFKSRLLLEESTLKPLLCTTSCCSLQQFFSPLPFFHSHPQNLAPDSSTCPATRHMPLPRWRRTLQSSPPFVS